MKITLSNLIDAMKYAGCPDDMILDAVIIFEERHGDVEADRKASDRARRARYVQRRNLTETEWAELRAAIIERDGGVCGYCSGIAHPPHVDHRTPLIRGGDNEPANLVVACGPCNSSKAGRTVEEWRGRQ